MDSLLLNSTVTFGEICAIRATNREVLLAHINAFIDWDFFKGTKEKPYLHVELSGEQLGCDGCSVDYATEADVPYESVPCSCGNPKHWLIKYEEVKMCDKCGCKCPCKCGCICCMNGTPIDYRGTTYPISK